MRSTRSLVTVVAAAVLTTTAAAQETVELVTADSVTIVTHVYPVAGTPRGVILAFHQGGGNGRGEYAPIAARLNGLGYAVVAPDLRAGGNRFDGVNETVRRAGREAPYCEAMPDLRAVSAWAELRWPGIPRILWGSSFSGALVLRHAALDSSGAVGVLAFSPASGGPMAECRGEDVADRITIPVLALRPASEMEIESVRSQHEGFRRSGFATHVATPGVHGSSMLVAGRVNGPVEEAWSVVTTFLERLVGGS